jgi:hypothetical protein
LVAGQQHSPGIPKIPKIEFVYRERERERDKMRTKQIAQSIK